VELRILLTNECQLRCQFCHLEGMSKHEKPRFISPKTAVNVFRHMKQLCGSSVTLSGGEPLLHPNFTQICESLAQEGARITLLTNGLLLGAYTKLLPHISEIHASLPSAIEANYVELTGGNLDSWFCQLRSLCEARSSTRLKINSTLLDGINDSEKEIRYLLNVSRDFSATLKIIRYFDPRTKRSARLVRLTDILKSMRYMPVTEEERLNVWLNTTLPTVEIAEVTCSFARRSRNPSLTCSKYRDLLITPDEKVVWCPWHILGWSLGYFVELIKQYSQTGIPAESFHWPSCPDYDKERKVAEVGRNENIYVARSR